MTWTTDELHQTLARYEQHLRDQRRTKGTIATYVGDARRFIESLASENGAGVAADPAGSAPSRAIRRGRVQWLGLVPAPAALHALVRAWETEGRPPQVAMPWPRERWRNAFPKHRPLFKRLPDDLDRPSVRSITALAGTSNPAAVNALLATLAWGYGWVGYGPHRADKMLAQADTPRRLQAVAKVLADGGAIAAYRSLGNDNRISGLGPAFGTKFLAFCQPDGMEPTALIHDELVTAWLETNGRPDLRAGTWAPRKYEAYLDQMDAWARELGVSAETVEYLIFQDEADKRPRSQWARRR